MKQRMALSGSLAFLKFAHEAAWRAWGCRSAREFSFDLTVAERRACRD
jgi:hypothetical protein